MGFTNCLELDSSKSTILTTSSEFLLYFVTLLPVEAGPSTYYASYVQRSDKKSPEIGSQSAIQIITNPVTNGKTKATSIILSDCKDVTTPQIRLNGICEDLPPALYCPINGASGFCSCPNNATPNDFFCLNCPESLPYFDPSSNTCGSKCLSNTSTLNSINTDLFICQDCNPTDFCLPSTDPSSIPCTCVTACPENTSLLYGNTCVDSCPIAAPYEFKNTCYSSCPDNSPLLNGNICVNTCPTTAPYILGNRCVSACPSAFPTINRVDETTNYCYCDGMPCGNPYDSFNTPSASQCITTPFQYCDAQNNLLSCKPPQVYSATESKCVCPPNLELCLETDDLCYNPKNQHCDYGNSNFVCNPGSNGFCECVKPATYNSSTGNCENCPNGYSTAGITCSCNNTCSINTDCLQIDPNYETTCSNGCCTTPTPPSSF
jgi:hypothetical protein